MFIEVFHWNPANKLKILSLRAAIASAVSDTSSKSSKSPSEEKIKKTRN